MTPVIKSAWSKWSQWKLTILLTVIFVLFFSSLFSWTWTTYFSKASGGYAFELLRNGYDHTLIRELLHWDQIALSVPYNWTLTTLIILFLLSALVSAGNYYNLSNGVDQWQTFFVGVRRNGLKFILVNFLYVLIMVSTIFGLALIVDKYYRNILETNMSEWPMIYFMITLVVLSCLLFMLVHIIFSRLKWRWSQALTPKIGVLRYIWPSPRLYLTALLLFLGFGLLSYGVNELLFFLACPISPYVIGAILVLFLSILVLALRVYFHFIFIAFVNGERFKGDLLIG